jgi:hypothetical protein
MNKTKEKTKIIPNTTPCCIAFLDYDLTPEGDVKISGLGFEPITAWKINYSNEFRFADSTPIGLNGDWDIGKECVIYNRDTSEWYLPYYRHGTTAESAIEFLKESLMADMEERKSLIARGCIKKGDQLLSNTSSANCAEDPNSLTQDNRTNVQVVSGSVLRKKPNAEN